MRSMSMLVPCAFALAGSAYAAKLVDVRTVDDEVVMIHWVDGVVNYRDIGEGPKAFSNPEGLGEDEVQTFGDPLNTSTAVEPASYTISSKEDPDFVLGVSPSGCYRKTKVNGSPWAWPDPPVTLEHTIFLKLPRKLRQGKRYNLAIAERTNTDVTHKSFEFDVYRCVSEAVHVNLIGYDPGETAMKSADLYTWLGDGGARDYSAYAGRRIVLVDAKTGAKYSVGSVTFWKHDSPDIAGWDLTKSDVWNCDFSAFARPGTYRLAIEGIGCSPEFQIRKDAYYEPLKTSVRGFFYMRIGEGMDHNPVPRQPRYIPGKDPSGFRVYRTTYGPWNPEWVRRGGDQWDVTDWSTFREPGNPTNPDAWGGHSDATDWDRNPSHISNVWDLLLPLVLTNGKPANDDLGIPESGNGVPDLIDEARYEVDFWLRLRDGRGGYCAGINNPSQNDAVMYQAAAYPFMAWASAANCAMLAQGYHLAGKASLASQYRDAAIAAWKTADGKDLDAKHGIGNGMVRGRDLKMLAATYLYVLTGDTAYEKAMAEESVANDPKAQLDVPSDHCQDWATAGYLMCAKYKWRPIHFPELLANMREIVLRDAQAKNVANTGKWPSRRASDNEYGWFQTIEEVQRVCIAHAVATDAIQKREFLRAMVLEADYGLGRNPMNMVQMTGLGSRCVEQMYTSGRNDGVPGVHPGHTPYMNGNAWSPGFMGDPQYYASRGYPAWSQWPQGEALWPARYCYANNEFTPQQTMRGKTCLYAYLYAIR